MADPLPRLELSQDGAGRVLYHEQWLQRLVQAHPGLLPVEEIEPAFMPLVPVCMELPTANGPVDNLFITPTGNLVLVECKLWRNPEMRRQVVAQVLDYAEGLSRWGYGDLEAATQRGAQLNGSRLTQGLYDLVAPELEESAFIDAVSRNLRLGRCLFFILGDGIREETEALVGHLQSHAGTHFALALTELALYRLPAGEILVQPRIIARTFNIERGIVRLDDNRLSVESAPQVRTTAKVASRQSLTAEQFYEHMAELEPSLPQKLRNFLAEAEARGIVPEFRRSLILRWTAVDGTSFNLGHIDTRGRLMTEAINWGAREKGILEITQGYVRQLADVLGGEIQSRPGNGDHIYVVVGGAVPMIEQALRHQDQWLRAIDQVTNSLNDMLGSTGY
ncbi:MAG: hypothetical protein RLQ25_08520 [Alphaproteobacteria bacterium]